MPSPKHKLPGKIRNAFALLTVILFPVSWLSARTMSLNWAPIDYWLAWITYSALLAAVVCLVVAVIAHTIYIEARYDE